MSTTVSQADFSYNVPTKMVQQVRLFIQDYVQTNELFDGQEVTDETLARYIVDTLDDWNSTPPMLSYMLDFSMLMTTPKFQGPRRWIADMAAGRVLRMLIIKRAKQDIPFTAGNVNVQPNAVWRNLEAIYQTIKAEYDSNKMQFKTAENMSGAYTVSHTEMWDGMVNDIDGY